MSTLYLIKYEIKITKEGIYHGNPGFSQNTLEKVGIWTGGYLLGQLGTLSEPQSKVGSTDWSDCPFDSFCRV